ncbi:MAG: Coenzyme F420 hydrogenase/dehydrogenase, beta subunit C-terminal domain [Phocaeicola sp.]
MINIVYKEECVGCNACTQICPKSCITMGEDHEGFLYPKVEESICIECSLCEKVCPVLVQSPAPTTEPLTYAAKNIDETIRRESSSGGVFTLLAEQTIRQGGVVFGARFDSNWEVEHHYVERIEDLYLFRGSKYLQSRIGNCFSQVREQLKSGRQVLFSGTPCQVAGLRLFLRKDYSNLLLVDFVCHGVPSPKVWRLYIKELLNSVEKKNLVSATTKPAFSDIRFRDKSEGWKKFSFAATIRIADENIVSHREPLNENIFMRGFLRDLYLRPSCHSCPSKSFKSGSDLTIADFWGIQNVLPEFDDDRGASLVMISTERGQKAYSDISGSQEKIEVTFASAYAGNPSITKSAKTHPNRESFFKYVDSKSVIKLIIKNTNPPFKQIAKSKIYNLASSMGLIEIIKRIR